jgi:hypothetical protein
MDPIIEEDSPTLMIVLLAIVLLFFVVGGLGLAWMGRVFTGKDEVMANDKRILQEKSLAAPAHAP